MSYADLIKSLASVIDDVNNDHVPVIVTRQNNQAVVIISLDDFNAYEETAYLLKSPANAKRLEESIARIESGLVKEYELIEP